jgi:RNA polymerase sigma-70 factor (ECF subfamily)
MDIPNLLLRARAGDAVALEQLLTTVRPRIRSAAEGVLSPHLGVRCDASDLAQLTLLTAATAFSAFRGGTEAEFNAWLRAILRQHLTAMHRLHVQAERRSLTREQTMDLGAAALSPAGTPSRLLLREEQRQEIDAALEQLPWEQREAVRLRFLDEWSTAQISEFLGKSERAVAGLLWRGMSHLKTILRTL